MAKTKITLSAVVAFIRNQLRAKLMQDLATLKMVRESDLEVCAYYHLRRFLRLDSRWTVLARKHVRLTGHFVDFVVFRKGIPRIAIELKWNRQSISREDCESLGQSISLLRVNRAYFMTTMIGNKKYQKIKKSVIEKNQLFEIVVPLNLFGSELDDWKAKGKVYKSKMVVGKAAGKVDA